MRFYYLFCRISEWLGTLVIAAIAILVLIGVISAFRSVFSDEYCAKATARSYEQAKKDLWDAP